MTSGTLRFLFITFGLVVGHFIYQATLGDPDWWRAVERSYFGFIALAYAWVCVRSEFKGN